MMIGNFVAATLSLALAAETKYKLITFHLRQCPAPKFRIEESAARKFDGPSACRGFDKLVVYGDMAESVEVNFGQSRPNFLSNGVTLLAPAKAKPFEDAGVFVRLIRDKECWIQIAYPENGDGSELLRASYVADRLFKDARVSGKFVKASELEVGPRGCPWRLNIKDQLPGDTNPQLRKYDRLGDFIQDEAFPPVGLKL